MRFVPGSIALASLVGVTATWNALISWSVDIGQYGIWLPCTVLVAFLILCWLSEHADVRRSIAADGHDDDASALTSQARTASQQASTRNARAS